MLEEQVLFYISGKGSARYRVTSKLYQLAAVFKIAKGWNTRSHFMNQQVLATRYSGSSWTFLATAGAGRRRGRLPCSHGTHGPACWASPEQGRARESSAERWLPRGRFTEPQPGTNFCPHPPQLRPADCLTVENQHPSIHSCRSKKCAEMGKRPIAACSLP